MADSKLTGLGEIGTPADTDVLYIVQDGTSYYVQRSDLIEVEDTPVNGNTTRPVSSNWAYDHDAATGGTHGVPVGEAILGTDDILQSPGFGAEDNPISANWAYLHTATHLEDDQNETITGDWTFSGDVAVDGELILDGTYLYLNDSATNPLDPVDTDNYQILDGRNSNGFSWHWGHYVDASGNMKYKTSTDGAVLMDVTYRNKTGYVSLYVNSVGTADTQISGWEGVSLTAGAAYPFLIDCASNLNGNTKIDGNVDLNGGIQDKIYDFGTEIDPTNGRYQRKTLSSNTTFTFGSGFTGGHSVTLFLDVAGTYTVTWPANMNWDTSGGGGPPTLTSNGSNERDIIKITNIGGQYYAYYYGMFT